VLTFCNSVYLVLSVCIDGQCGYTDTTWVLARMCARSVRVGQPDR